MQRLSVVLGGTLGSSLRDALEGGSAAAGACLSAPRAKACLPPLFVSLLLVYSTAFFVIND
jgi:hypothetical protein